MQVDSLFSECHNALIMHFCMWLNVRSTCDPDTDATRAEHGGTNMAMDTPLLPPVTVNQLVKDEEQKCTRQRQIPVLREQDSMKHVHVKSIWD